MIKHPFFVALLSASALVLTACGGDDSSKTTASTAAASGGDSATTVAKELKIGVCPGPYGTMIESTITPILKEEGYTVTVVEFTDYVQPNLALDGGDLDANLMQHASYLNNIVETQGQKLEAATNVPTLGMGVFSQKVKNFEELKSVEDGQVALPNDAVNLARALRLARDLGIITLNEVADENKASVADIKDNPYNLEFVPMEAAQISRSLDSVTLGFIPGNYAYAAKLDYHQALGVENVQEDIKNVIAIRQGDAALKELFFKTVHSVAYKKAIENNSVFDAFTRPAWWNEVQDTTTATATTDESPAIETDAGAQDQASEAK